MNWDGYINWKILGIAEGAKVGLGCWTSSNGLPEELLDFMFVAPPTTYVRLVTQPFQAEQLDRYLQDVVGLNKGDDYVRHANGVRGGTYFFDFHKPDAISRLETFADQQGFKPIEKPKDPFAPAPDDDPATARMKERVLADRESAKRGFGRL